MKFQRLFAAAAYIQQKKEKPSKGKEEINLSGKKIEDQNLIERLKQEDFGCGTKRLE